MPSPDARKTTWEYRKDDPEWRSNRRKYLRERHQRRMREDEAYRAKRREYKWLKKLGVTRADFERFYSDQDGKCALCGVGLTNFYGPEEGATPCIDHCHKTGRLRGLLCIPCNRHLGLYENWWDPDVVHAYLGRAARPQMPTRLTSPRERHLRTIKKRRRAKRPVFLRMTTPSGRTHQRAIGSSNA